MTTLAATEEITLSITTSVSAAQGYASIYAASRRSRDEVASTGEGTTTASSTVTISPAAEQAAKNDVSGGIKLPDAAYWMRKDFPDDIVAEAKARLEERQPAPGIGNGYLPGSISNLPLLPENLALLNQFHQEMKEIGHDNGDPEKNARFNRLLNLSMRVQIEGWKAPMTEAGAQRELDIQQAMAVLDTSSPAQTPATNQDTLPDPMAGWNLRWQKEGLDMPSASAAPGKSLWLDLADKAGIGQEEFMTKARDLAASFKGNALTLAIEQFVSERYVAVKTAREAA